MKQELKPKFSMELKIVKREDDNPKEDGNNDRNHHNN